MSESAIREPTEIEGVGIWRPRRFVDERGVFAEIFRDDCGLRFRPVQWNCVNSIANVLRGVHLHFDHFDYWMVLQGRALVGLHDLRVTSPTHGRSVLWDWSAEGKLAALEIPPGVAHGFYFPDDSLQLCGVSRLYDSRDELGCRWNDPALNIAWPAIEPILSDRDRSASSFEELAGRAREHFLMSHRGVACALG